MKEKTVFVPNISCIYCGKNIKRELEGINGVKTVKINLPLREVYIRWSSPATWKVISTRLTDIDYPTKERETRES